VRYTLFYSPRCVEIKIKNKNVNAFDASQKEFGEIAPKNKNTEIVFWLRCAREVTTNKEEAVAVFWNIFNQPIRGVEASDASSRPL